MTVPSPSRRPQPVLGAGQAAAVATVLTGLLVSWLSRRGVLVPAGLADPVADLIEVGIVAGAGALSSLWAALWARRRVTPADDPRDDEGRPLQPAAAVDLAELARELLAAAAATRPQGQLVNPAEPATAPIPVPVVDVAALRREYELD